MTAGEEVIFESPRGFQVWSWHVSHSTLLLRSNPSREATTRIEILFKPASAVSLSRWLDGIQIACASRPPPGRVMDVLGRSLEDWEDAFIVRSTQGCGWVVASGVHGREDDHEFHAPEMFDGWERRSDVRELFRFVRS